MMTVLRNISSSLHRLNNCNVHLPVRQCSASHIQRTTRNDEEEIRVRSRHRLRAGPMNAAIEHAWSSFRSLDGYSFTKIRPPVLSNIEDGEVGGAHHNMASGGGVGAHHMASRHFWFLFASKTEDPADLVESWCRLTLIFSKDLEDLTDDQQLDLMSHLLIQKMHLFNFKQLRQVLQYLTLLHTKSSRFVTLTETIDEYLLASIQAHGVTEDNIDRYLEISSIQLRWTMLTTSLRMDLRPENFTSTYTSHVIKLLLTKHLHALTPQQFVFCMFLAGIARRLPECEQEQAFAALCSKFETVLPMIGPIEQGIICHGFHQCNLRLGKEQPVIKSLLFQTLLDFPVQDIQKHQITLSSIMKLLKNRGTYNREFVCKVMDKFEPYLDCMGPGMKIRLLQLLQSVLISTHNKDDFLNKFLASLDNNLGGMRLKDLEQLTFALLYLNVDHKATYAMIMRAKEWSYWSNTKSGRSLVFLTAYMAHANTFDVPNIEGIMKEVNECDFSNLETLNGLGKANKFLFRLNVPLFANVDETFKKRFVKRNRRLIEQALVYVLEIDFACFINKIRLNTTLLPHIRQELFGFSRKLNAERSLPKDFKNSKLTYHQAQVFQVYKDLNRVLAGSEQYSVHIDFAIPISTTPQVLVRSKELMRGQEKIITDCGGNRNGNSGVAMWQSNLRQNGNVKLVFVVPKKSEIYGDKIYGRIRVERNYMKKLGMNVVVINWLDYIDKLKKKESHNYLRFTLKKYDIETRKTFKQSRKAPSFDE